MISLRMGGARLVAGLATAVAIFIGGCGGESGAPSLPAGFKAPNARPDRPSYAPWPGAGHDPLHTGSSPSRGPSHGHIIWRRRLEGNVTPGPAVGPDGTIYAASNGGVLHALDSNGGGKWVFDAGSDYGSDLSTTPAVTPSGVILWPGPANTLYALGPDGRLLWKRSFASFPLSPVIASRQVVLVVEMSGVVHALSLGRHGGRLRWSLDLGGGPSYGSPALAPDGTVYTSSGDDLVAVTTGGGVAHVAWRFPTGGLIEVSPAVAPDGTIVIGSNHGTEYGVGPDGSESWHRDLGELTYSSPAVSADGIAYFGDHSGAVSAVRASDGVGLASYLGQGGTAELRSVGVWTAPLIDARHSVYFGTRLGHIYGFRSDGRRLFDVKTGGTVDSYPVLDANGHLIVGSADGYLYAIGD